MIFETKTIKKADQKHGRLSSFILGTLLAFFVIVSAANFNYAQAADVTAPAAVNDPKNLPTCGQNGVAKVTNHPGLYIYSCLFTDREGSIVSSNITFTLLLDNVKLPTTPGTGACSSACQTTWFLDGKEITQAKNQVEYTVGQYNPAYEKGIITAKATVNGVTTTGTKDQGAQGSIDGTAKEGGPQNADGLANTIAGFVAKVLTAIVVIITELLYNVTYYFIIPVVQLVLSMNVHDSSFAAVILSGWVFVRNVMNIFFILAMLIIALATLFRVEKYNYKHMIPELVLMVLLINFSLVIAQLILGVADTLQAQFLPNNKEVLGNLAYQLMVKPATILNVHPWQGTFSSVVSAIFYLFFALASFFAFLVIAAFLVVRVIAIWILLLLSPVAYGLRILPQTHHYSEEWWSNFMKYAFVTPILGFFLHIIASLAQSQAKYVGAMADISIQSSKAQNLSTFVTVSLSNAMIIFFLFLALEIAEKFGTAGAGAIVHWAKHNTVKPFEFAGEALKDKFMKTKYNATEKWAVPNKDDNAAVKKLKSFGFMAANPAMSTKAWLHHREEEVEEAKHKAEAAAKRAETFRRTGGMVDTRDNIKHEEKHEEEAMGRGKTKSAKEIQEKLDEIHHSDFGKEHDGHTEVRGWIKAAVSNGTIKEIVEKKYGSYNSENLKKFIEEYTAGDEEGKRFMGTINGMGKDSKDIAAIGIDKDTPEKAEEAQIAYFDNLDDAGKSQVKMRGVGYGSGMHKAFVDEVDANPQIPVSNKNLTYLVAPKIDVKTGHPIFESPEQEKAFNDLQTTHPKLYTKLYNQALGVNNQNNKLWIPADKIPRGKSSHYSKNVLEPDVDASGKPKLDKKGNVVKKKRTIYFTNVIKRPDNTVEYVGKTYDKPKDYDVGLTGSALAREVRANRGIITDTPKPKSGAKTPAEERASRGSDDDEEEDELE